MNGGPLPPEAVRAAVMCPACAAGPDGIVGHLGLRARSLGENGITFECRECHAIWSRTYSTTDHFFWLHRERVGADVGCSLPAPPLPDVAAPPVVTATRDPVEHWLAIQMSWKQARRLPVEP